MSWQQVQLGEVADIISGATPKSTVPSYWGGEIAWATPTDLSNLKAKHIASTERRITDAGLKSCSARLLPPNSVLFSSRAPIGLVAINRTPMATNQGFKSFVPSADLNADYLYWWLVANKQQIQDLGNGATFKEVSKGIVSNVKISLPPVREQCRIAAILDKADAIRRKRLQALAIADDFLKSVFLEVFGDPHRNPHNYPVREFETLLTIPLRNGISPSSKGAVSAHVLTLSAITGEKFDAIQIKEGKFLRPISKTDQVDVGDFYICRGNGSPDLVGKGYFADQSMEGVAFPDTMIAAKINADEICRGFFEVIWNSPFVRGQIIEAARTTNGTFKINQTATGGIRIPTPPKARQEVFEHVVRKVHDVRERLSFEDDLFASLSQRAFRGEL